MIFNNEYIEPYEEIIGSYTKEFIIEQLNRLNDKSKDLIATKIVELDKSNYYKETYIDILKKQISKAIEVLKLCNSKCAKEVIDILRGEDNES